MEATEATAAYPASFDPTKPGLDYLPERAGHRLPLTWHAASDDYSGLAGFAEIGSGKDRATYAITEVPVSVGRGFFFTKLGAKPTATKQGGYAVTCVRAGDAPVGSCECSGFKFNGSCRHLDSVATLILNGWI